MILVDEPPIASASEVFRSMFENVAGSEGSFWIGTPFSSTKRRRRRPAVEPEPKISEWISPRLELLRLDEPGADALDDRTNSPLLLVGTWGSWAAFNARVGLDEEAYRIGDESPGGALGVLSTIDGCFSGELIFMLALPVGAAAGDERKNKGDEYGTFWRAACGVPCDWACCDRRGAGEDIFADVNECLSRSYGFRGTWKQERRVKRVAKINLLRPPRK